VRCWRNNGKNSGYIGRFFRHIGKIFPHGKSCDVTLTPTTPGVPEKLQVVIQLKRNNENYGQPSDAVSVTVNP
jgi:hypothetical protein